MDFNFGNIYDKLDTDDKRVALAFVLSIPIAYVLCLRVYDGFLTTDIYTRLAYTISLSLMFMIANYFAIIIGQGMSQIFIPFRYLQLLLPQSSALAVSLAYGYTDITHLSVAYGFVLILIVLTHLLFRLAISSKDAGEDEAKAHNRTKKKRNKKHNRRH